MAHTDPSTNSGPGLRSRRSWSPLVVALALTLFAWPASRQEPGLAGGRRRSGAGAQFVEQRLASQKGAFEIHRYAERRGSRGDRGPRRLRRVRPDPRRPRGTRRDGASAPVAQLLEQAVAGGAGARRRGARQRRRPGLQGGSARRRARSVGVAARARGHPGRPGRDPDGSDVAGLWAWSRPARCSPALRRS